MKKHDEGYALAFVLVVVTVLCLVALSMMSIALQNMRSERATVTRMQEKYAAQGEIEKVVARFEAQMYPENGATTLASLDANWVNRLCEPEEPDAEPAVICTGVSMKTRRVDDREEKYLLIRLETRGDGLLKILCDLEITGEVITEDEFELGKPIYTITKPKWKYAFYNIIEGGAADE